MTITPLNGLYDKTKLTRPRTLTAPSWTTGWPNCHFFQSSFKDWTRQHDVDELLSQFALAHVDASTTVAAYARDDLLDKRKPVMQRSGNCIAG